MALFVKGDAVAAEVLKDLGLEIKDLSRRGVIPRLAVVLAGSNPASTSYVAAKQKCARGLGVAVGLHRFSQSITHQDLAAKIQQIVRRKNLHGVLVQLPLPPQISRQKILDLVPPGLDVDCLATANKQALAAGQNPAFLPPAPAAVLQILNYYNIILPGKNILIIGQGELIGKPLAAMLRSKGLGITTADVETRDLVGLTKQADIIVSGTGQPGLVKGGMIKPGAVVIDAGTAGTLEGVAGDVDTATVAPKASLLAAVPGGVGPVTIAMLLSNVVKSAGRLVI